MYYLILSIKILRTGNTLNMLCHNEINKNEINNNNDYDCVDNHDFDDSSNPTPLDDEDDLDYVIILYDCNDCCIGELKFKFEKDSFSS
jgi:hypothetical protein